MFIRSFAQASSTKARSPSRPKTSLPVTGNLATETFFGPSLAGDRRVPTREAVEALTSDSTPRVDSACYRRNRLQQLVWGLKTLCWIFLKEFFKENDDRLWKIFELLKRQ